MFYNEGAERLEQFAWRTSREAASTILLGNVFLCLSTPTEKNIFLITNLNFPLSVKSFYPSSHPYTP